MINKFVRSADVAQPGETDLRDDSTELAGCGRDTVGRTPVARGEGFSRNDESRRVRAEVLEEVREAVQEDERLPWAT